MRHENHFRYSVLNWPMCRPRSAFDLHVSHVVSLDARHGSVSLDIGSIVAYRLSG